MPSKEERLANIKNLIKFSNKYPDRYVYSLMGEFCNNILKSKIKNAEGSLHRRNLTNFVNPSKVKKDSPDPYSQFYINGQDISYLAKNIGKNKFFNLLKTLV